MQAGPNVIGCNAAMSTCENGDEWEQALNFLSLMPGMQAKPNVISCSAAINVCEKNHEWEKALSLLSLMPGMRGGA